MLSMKVLQDHKEKFGIDFAKNKQALNDICKISSKTLKNKLAGYITKFIKNEFNAKIEKAKRIADTKEVVLEEKKLNTIGDAPPVQASS
jgi:ribosomal protein S17E